MSERTHSIGFASTIQGITTNNLALGKRRMEFDATVVYNCLCAVTRILNKAAEGIFIGTMYSQGRATGVVNNSKN